jgi:hypothetical protein
MEQSDLIDRKLQYLIYAVSKDTLFVMEGLLEKQTCYVCQGHYHSTPAAPLP